MLRYMFQSKEKSHQVCVEKILYETVQQFLSTSAVLSTLIKVHGEYFHCRITHTNLYPNLDRSWNSVYFQTFFLPNLDPQPPKNSSTLSGPFFGPHKYYLSWQCRCGYQKWPLKSNKHKYTHAQAFAVPVLD